MALGYLKVQPKHLLRVGQGFGGSGRWGTPPERGVRRAFNFFAVKELNIYPPKAQTQGLRKFGLVDSARD